MIKQVSFTLMLLLGFSGVVLAADSTANTPPPVQTNNTEPHSLQFARQAGIIVGVLQACGQNVADLHQRIIEAIDKMSANTVDKAATIVVYQQAIRVAQANEKKTQTIPCTKALEDYRNLPIMQADYKEKVIAQLNSSNP